MIIQNTTSELARYESKVLRDYRTRISALVRLRNNSAINQRQQAELFYLENAVLWLTDSDRIKASRLKLNKELTT